ncbi:hypothetical protein K501DRAFT_43451 [Backusella circina FSU 941]|nr:hypothetical protein K501DRAFT_43451 [Backusella circina FSU 941]
MATPHSRKNSRVFRSPDVSEAVPQTKIKVEVKEEPNTLMDIDADDEEAGTILMALAQDSERRRSQNEKIHAFYDEKPSRSHSMSIKNLLDTDHSMASTQPSPYTSQINAT